MYQLEEELSVVREEKQALDDAVSQIRLINVIVQDYSFLSLCCCFII